VCGHGPAVLDPADLVDLVDGQLVEEAAGGPEERGAAADLPEQLVLLVGRPFAEPPAA